MATSSWAFTVQRLLGCLANVFLCDSGAARATDLSMANRFCRFEVKPQILCPQERDRYENDKYYYENDRYHRWENERYHGRENGRNERENGRYNDRWENQRYTTSYESERYPSSYENEHYHEGHERYDRECFGQKMSNYIDPRSRHGSVYDRFGCQDTIH